LEKDFGFGGVNIGISPFGPGCQSFVEGSETVHVLVNIGPILYEIPSKNHNQPTYCVSYAMDPSTIMTSKCED